MEFLSFILIRLEEKIKELGIELVILSVPSRVAQEVTDKLADYRCERNSKLHSGPTDST